MLVGLLLAGLGTFLPSGEAWTERNSIRDTETYSVLTYDFARSNPDVVLKDPQAKGWNHASLDGDAGSNLMIAASFTAIGALLFAVIGTTLSFPARTIRVGAIFSIVGAAAVATVTILVILGMRARVAEVYDSAVSLNPLAGIFLLGFGFLFLLLGAAFALTVRPTSGPQTNTWEDYPANLAAHSSDGGNRTLICPDCGSRSKAPLGVVPTCSSCGFHSNANKASASGSSGDMWAVPTS